MSGNSKAKHGVVTNAMINRAAEVIKNSFYIRISFAFSGSRWTDWWRWLCAQSNLSRECWDSWNCLPLNCQGFWASCQWRITGTNIFIIRLTYFRLLIIGCKQGHVGVLWTRWSGWAEDLYILEDVVPQLPPFSVPATRQGGVGAWLKQTGPKVLQSCISSLS